MIPNEKILVISSRILVGFIWSIIILLDKILSGFIKVSSRMLLDVLAGSLQDYLNIEQKRSEHIEY
jgi:hypothetical protein